MCRRTNTEIMEIDYYYIPKSKTTKVIEPFKQLHIFFYPLHGIAPVILIIGICTRSIFYIKKSADLIIRTMGFKGNNETFKQGSSTVYPFLAFFSIFFTVYYFITSSI